MIHNAEFDLGFVNAELKRLEKKPLDLPVVDTLLMARKRFPGAPASLDALCRRYNIDLSGREKHGAKLDGELTAAVYLELIGGRQPGLEFARGEGSSAARAASERPARAPRPHAPAPEELALHARLRRQAQISALDGLGFGAAAAAWPRRPGGGAIIP